MRALGVRHVGLSVAMVMVLEATAAEAQIIGTFGWQTQPFCNIVTLTVVQQGGAYQLTGHDNLCGAGVAPVTGTAVVTGGGVALGFEVSLPTGRAAHLTATVTLATVSGAWADADGNTGAFSFNGATGGAPRPAPATAAVVTTAQLAPTVYAGSGSAMTVARSDHIHDDRYYTIAQTDAAITAKGTAVIQPAGFGTGFDYTAAGGASGPGFTMPFVTSRAGYLDVQLFARAVAACSSPAEHILFLMLDGVAMRNSVFFSSASEAAFERVQLRGVTTSVVAAGAHTLQLWGECANGVTATLNTTLFTQPVIVVHP